MLTVNCQNSESFKSQQIANQYRNRLALQKMSSDPMTASEEKLKELIHSSIKHLTKERLACK